MGLLDDMYILSEMADRYAYSEDDDDILCEMGFAGMNQEDFERELNGEEDDDE